MGLLDSVDTATRAGDADGLAAMQLCAAALEQPETGAKTELHRHTRTWSTPCAGPFFSLPRIRHPSAPAITSLPLPGVPAPLVNPQIGLGVLDRNVVHQLLHAQDLHVGVG